MMVSIKLLVLVGRVQHYPLMLEEETVIAGPEARRAYFWMTFFSVRRAGSYAAVPHWRN